MSDIIVNLDINNTGFNVKIRNAERLLNQLSSSFRSTESAARSSTKGFNLLTANLRDMTVIGYGVTGAIQAMNAALFSWQFAIIEASAEIEKLTILLTGLSDAQTQFSKNYDAHKNLRDMVDLAREAPFAMNELMKSFVKFQSVNLDDPKRMVQALADAIAAFGGGNDEFHRASVAITQMAGKGVISMEELRQQLGEAVPSAIRVMARELDMTYGELVEVVSSGALGARKGLDALTKGFESDFGGTAKKMMETWSGMTSVLKTNWMLFLDQIGQGGLFDSAKDFLGDINSALTDPELLAWANHFGERLGVLVERLNAMFNAITSNIGTVEKLVDVSTTLFAVWFGTKGISAVVSGFASLFGLASKIVAPLRVLSMVVTGAAAAWVYFSDNVDDVGKKIGILERLSRDVDKALETDALVQWRVLWDDVTESVGGLWEKIYEGSAEYIPLVNDAIRNNSSVLEEFIGRVEAATGDGVAFDFTPFQQAWDRLWDKNTDTFSEVFSVLFDTLIVEVGVQLSALFLDDLPRWIDQGLRTLPQRIKAAVADAKASFFSLLIDANDRFNSESENYSGIDAALSAEMSAARMASAMVSIEYAVKATEKNIEDTINNTNEAIADAMELRQTLIERIQKTGNNLSPSDQETQSQYFAMVEGIWSSYEGLLARLEQAENDQLAIIQQATQSQAEAYEHRRQIIATKIQEVVDEIDGINLDIESQSNIATPEQTSRLAELSESLALLQAQMDETELAQQNLSATSIDSARLAPEQRIQYEALERIIRTLKQALEQAGNALADFNDKSKDGIEDIEFISPELKKAQNSLLEFSQTAGKIIRGSIPGGKELQALKEFEQAYVKFVQEDIPTLVANGEKQSVIDGLVQQYHDARAVLEDDYAKAVERASEKEEKLTASTHELITVISDMRDQFESLSNYDGLDGMLSALESMGDPVDRLKSGLSGVQDVAVEAGRSVVAAGQTVVDLVKQFEGLKLEAYLDQAGVPTIGYGHTGPEVKIGMRIDMQEAERLFAQDLAKFEDVVRDSVNVSLSENQAAALTSLAYNIGEGAFKGSTLVKLLNMGDYEAAAKEFDKWTKVTVNGLKETSQGLVNRRNLEESVFRDSSNSLQKLTDDTQKATDTTVEFGSESKTALSGVSSQAEGLSAAFIPATNAAMAFVEVMKRYSELDTVEGFEVGVQSYYQSLFDLSPLMLQVMEYNDKLATGQHMTSEEMIAGKNAVEELEKANKGLAEKSRNLVDAQEELIASGKLFRRNIPLTEAELNDLADSYGTAYAAKRKFNTGLVDVNDLLKNNKMNVKEAAEAINEYRWELMEAQGPFQAWIADLESAIPSFEQFSVNIMDSFVDTLVDGLAEGKLEFESFVDDVKKMLARLAINKIIVTVLGSVGLSGITGVTGASSVAGAVTGAGTTGSLASLSSLSGLSSLTKIGSLLTGNSLGSSLASWMGYDSATAIADMYSSSTFSLGNLAGTSNWVLGGSSILGSLFGSTLFDGEGYSSIGSSIGSTAGSIIGSMLNVGLPGVGTILGSLLGGAGGGWLGSLFGGDDEPKFGGYASSFSGKGFEDDASAEGAFGLNFGVSDKGSKNIEGSDYQDALDGLAEVSNVLSEFYGSELETLTRTYLNTTYGDFTNWGKDLDSAFQNMFSTIISAADEVDPSVDGLGNALAAAVESMGGLTGTASEMATQIETGIAAVSAAQQVYGTDLGKVLGMFDGGEFGSLGAASAQWVQYIQMFRDTTETSSDTIVRLVEQASVFGTAMELTGQKLENFSGSGKDFLYFSDQFATKLSEAGSSLETLTSQQSSYFDAYYSEEEQLFLARQEALGSVTQFNEQMGLTGTAAITSKEGLRAYIESLDLTSESGMEAYIAAMSVAGAMDTFETSLEDLEDAFDDAFLTDFERSLKKGEKGFDDVEKKLKKINVELPDTRDEFVALALALKESDSAAYEYLLTLTDGVDAYYSGVEAQTEALDSIWQALDETSYTSAQMAEFEAGLVSVGLSADITRDELLKLVQSGELTADQIAFLYGSLDMLSAKFGEVASSASSGSRSSGSSGGGRSSQSQKTEFNLKHDPSEFITTNSGRLALGKTLLENRDDNYYWYKYFLGKMDDGWALGDSIGYADKPRTIERQYQSSRGLSYVGKDNPFDIANKENNSQIVFLRRLTELGSWNDDRTEEMINHLVGVVGQTREQAERAIQRALDETDDQFNVRYYVDAINRLKATKSGDKNAQSVIGRLLGELRDANADIWVRLFDEHVPRVLSFNEKMLRELEMTPDSLTNWRYINDAMSKLGVAVPKTAAELSRLRHVLDPEDFELLAVYAEDFDAIFDALEPFQEWLSTPTSEESANSADRMKALFESWAITLPTTKDALRDLVSSGRLTDEQLLILAANLGDLQSTFDETSSSVSELEDRLQALIDAIDPDSDIEKIRKAADFLKNYNLSLDRDQIGDYLRSLSNSLNSGTIDAFEGVVDTISAALDYIDAMVEERDSAVESLRGEENYAGLVLAGTDALNAFLDRTGSAKVESIGNLDRQWLADYLEGLNPKTVVGAEMLDFWISVQESVLDGLEAIDEISDTILGLYDSLDVKLSNESALKVLTNTLTEWGVSVPDTTAAMRELITSGSLTQEQLLLLAEYSSVVTSAYGKQSDALNEQISVANQTASSLRTLSNSLTTIVKQVDNDIATVSKVSADLVALRADALEKLSSSAADIDMMDEAIDKAGEYRAALMSVYNEQLNALNQQRNALENTQKTILDWVSNMRTTLSSQQSLSLMRSRYQDVILKSQQGDTEALGDLTGAANDYIDVLRETSGDSIEFARQYGRILAQVENIGTTVVDQEIDRVVDEIETLKSGTLSKLQELSGALSTVDQSIKSQITAQEELVKSLQDQLQGLSEQEIESMSELTLMDMRARASEAERIIQAIAGISVQSNSLSVPGFASGGAFGGGLRLVGERGPELEFTGPSRIVSNSDITKHLSSANSELVYEIQSLRSEVKTLRLEQQRQAHAQMGLQRDTRDILNRWEVIGQPSVREGVA